MTELKKIPSIVNRDLKKEKIDVKLTTIDCNFGSSSPVKEINVIDVNDSDLFKDAYSEAEVIAKEMKADTVIDLQYGLSESFFHSFDKKKDFKNLYYVNFNEFLENAQKKYKNSSAKFVDTNIRSVNDLDLLLSRLDLSKKILITFNGVIERLENPLVTLTFIKKVLAANPDNRVVLSTVNKSAISEANIREWSFDEMGNFLLSSGFLIERKGTFNEDKCSFFVLKFDKKYYNDFLTNAEFVVKDVSAKTLHVVITTEHALVRPVSGGIGSYLADAEKLNPDDILVLYISNYDARENGINGYKFLNSFSFFDLKDIEKLDLPAISLKSLEQLLFFYFNVSSIEYQEFLGIGSRIAQAKKAGFISKKIPLIVHCHSSLLYLEAGTGNWLGLEGVQTAQHEKISIELADIVNFPSEFLKDFYIEEAGYQIDNMPIITEQYPYPVQIKKHKEYKKITRLVFFGRRKPHKGYEEFVGAIENTDLSMYGIDEIVFIGEKYNDMDSVNVRVDKLREKYKISEMLLTREDVKTKLAELAKDSLIVMPYKLDNHPVSLSEAIEAGCEVLAANAAGIPAMIPKEFHKDILAKVSAMDLSKGLVHLLKMNLKERIRLIHNLQETYKNLRLEANKVFTNNIRTAYSKYFSPTAFIRPSADLFTVVVTLYNPLPRYTKDLCFAFNNQVLKPSKIIFVNDCSKEDSINETKSILKENLKVAYEVINNETNSGVEKSRNNGLKAAKTRYVISADNDNIPLPSNFYDFVNAIVNNNFTAITSFNRQFIDETDWLTKKRDAEVFIYRPEGGGITLSLFWNSMGDAHGIYDVDFMKQIGGWDEYKRSSYSDLALYTKIISTGGKLLVIPRVEYLYRTRDDSMIRTYSVYEGEKSQGRSISKIYKFDAFRLIGIARNYLQLQKHLKNFEFELESSLKREGVLMSENTKLKEINKSLKKILSRKTVKTSIAITDKLYSFSPLKRSVSAGFNLSNKIKGLLKRKRN